MSDPLSSAVLSLFQVSARTAPCPPPNFNFGGTQTCAAGPGGSNLFNFTFGGKQRNTAGRGTSGAPGSP
ncbi:MAG: hypothetical protein ACRDRR_04035 [Pseudonocardiaceae bacterium]